MSRVNPGNLFTKGRFIVKVTRGSVVFKKRAPFLLDRQGDMGDTEISDLCGNNLSVQVPHSLTVLVCTREFLIWEENWLQFA